VITAVSAVDTTSSIHIENLLDHVLGIVKCYKDDTMCGISNSADSPAVVSKICTVRDTGDITLRALILNCIYGMHTCTKKDQCSLCDTQATLLQSKNVDYCSIVDYFTGSIPYVVVKGSSTIDISKSNISNEKCFGESDDSNISKDDDIAATHAQQVGMHLHYYLCNSIQVFCYALAYCTVCYQHC
jgi:hypothetical protein